MTKDIKIGKNSKYPKPEAYHSDDAAAAKITSISYCGESISQMAERRLRELIEAGNLEAIRLGMEIDRVHEWTCDALPRQAEGL